MFQILAHQSFVQIVVHTFVNIAEKSFSIAKFLIENPSIVRVIAEMPISKNTPLEQFAYYVFALLLR